jgi:tetratricopeptide (TPR) repeat protein
MGMKKSLALLILSALLFSCAGQGVRAYLKPAGQKNVKQRDGGTRESIAAHLDRKEHEKALEKINDELKKGVPELYYGGEYVDALNGLLEKGAGLYYLGEYEAAGLAFRLAFESYPSAAGIRGRVQFSPDEIGALIEGCSTNLMEKGLISYREGALQNAIGIWEKIPAFDPANEEAKRALKTAITQLRNLNDLQKQGAVQAK